MVDRILELAKALNMTPSQFADEIGIQRSGMSHLVSGRNKPSLDLILKILQRFPEVRADWLLQGKSRPADQEPVPSDNDVNLFTNVLNPDGNALSQEQEQDREQDEPVQAVRPGSKRKMPEITPASHPGSLDQIEKVVVFYNDRTFKEYSPRD